MKIHELLKISSNLYISLEPEEKVNKIFDYLKDSPLLSHIEGSIYCVLRKKNERFWQMYIEEINPKFESKKLSTNLEVKLKSNNSNIKKLTNLRIWLKNMRKVFNPYFKEFFDKYNFNYLVWTQIFYEELTNLIITEEEAEAKLKKKIKNISEAMLSSIKNDLEKCLEKIITDEVKKEIKENGRESTAALKIVDYDRYKELFPDDEFLNVEKRIIKKLENPSSVGTLNTEEVNKLEKKIETLQLENSKIQELLTPFQRRKNHSKLVENKIFDNIRKAIEKIKTITLPAVSENDLSELRENYRFFVLVSPKDDEDEEARMPKFIDYCFDKITKMFYDSFLFYKKINETNEKLKEDIRKEKKVSQEAWESNKNLFQTYIKNLAEMEDDNVKIQIGKLEKEILKIKKEIQNYQELLRDRDKEMNRLMLGQIRTEKYRKKAHKLKKSIQDQNQLKTKLDEKTNQKIANLTTNRTFLIQQALKLSNQIIKGEKDLQTLGQENLLLNKQNLLQAQTITELEAEIEILEKLATKELRSKNRENDNLQYEIGDLEEVIKKAVISLGKEKKKTKKLNYVKKVGSLLMEKLRNDLTDLKSEFRNAQAEISQLKQENQDLEERKKEIKKESNAKIKELKKKSTEQQTTIQQLQDEKTSLEQEKTRVEEELSSERSQFEEQRSQFEEQRSQFEEQQKNWQQREQKLLAEIELLKNPPLTSENKENVKQNVIVKEIIKEVFIKSLESNELGFKLSAEEKDKLDNLSLQEMEVYHSQLIKGKVNHLENQVKQLGLSKSREREIIWWVILVILVSAIIGQTILLIRKSKHRKRPIKC